MKYIETIKSISLVILFTLSVTLAAIYITNTQRLTMAGESPLDLDSLLFLRGEGSEVTELDRSFVLPETVCYSVGGDMRCIYADESTASDIYSAASGMLIEALSKLDTAMAVTDREALLAECTSSRDFVYFKYHTSLPSRIILTSINGDTLSSQTTPFGDDTRSVREVFVLFEPVSANTATYSAVVICDGGEMLSLDISGNINDDSGEKFQLDTLTAFNTARSAVKCSFAASTDSTGSGTIMLEKTSVVTEDIISAQLLAVNEPIVGGQALSESMLRFFEFNPDRINTYNESDNVSVYVEGNMTLRVEPQLIRYTASSGDGIEAASLLGYESYSGNYSVIELIGAAGGFIDGIRTASGGIICGEAKPTLTSIKSDGTVVTLRYTLTFAGTTIYAEGFEPIVGYTLTFDGGRLTSADICTLSFASGIGSVASYTQRWTLDKLAPRLDPTARESVGRVEGGYVISSLGNDYDDAEITTASFEWMLVY